MSTTRVAARPGSAAPAGGADPPLLSLSHVDFDYGRGSFGLTDLSFEVHSGEVVGLIGPNGSGKTTALRVALGLLDAREGDIEPPARTPARKPRL